MIGVGIHDNLVITQVSKNDKGTLAIKIKKEQESNPLELLNASTESTSFDDSEREFLIFPPKAENYQGGQATAEEVLKNIAQIKDQLNHILLSYTTTNNIKWDILKGTGVTVENMETKVTSQDVINQIYNNIVDQFIAMMRPFTKPDGKKVRMVFIQQSQAKHYPTFRKRFLDSYPYIS